MWPKTQIDLKDQPVQHNEHINQRSSTDFPVHDLRGEKWFGKLPGPKFSTLYVGKAKLHKAISSFAY